MYTIGELSKIVKISIDALRYYDEIDLLKPDHIDAVTRYRYYSAEKVNVIITIMEWKQYGFSLEVIKTLLTNGVDIEQMQETFLKRLKELNEERSKIEQTIKLLEVRINDLEGEYSMTRKTVLVIDDSAFLRQIVQDILEKHGFTVIGAAVDGETGVVKFADLKPDVVLLDLGLPDIDGIHVANRIKDLDINAKIVICSARNQLGTVLDSFNSGAIGYVSKPFLPEVLLSAINAAITNETGFSQDKVMSYMQGLPPDELIRQLAQVEIDELYKMKQ